MINVKVPRIVRGSGFDSGSAELAVMASLQTPGVDVLCSASERRLVEMRVEIVAVLEATGIHSNVLTARGVHQIIIGCSRILLRQPRRDGAGVRGMNAQMIWLDEADYQAEVEAIGLLRSGRKLNIVIDGVVR